jgi:hypothetical protein
VGIQKEKTNNKEDGQDGSPDELEIGLTMPIHQITLDNLLGIKVFKTPKIYWER